MIETRILRSWNAFLQILLARGIEEKNRSADKGQRPLTLCSFGLPSDTWGLSSLIGESTEVEVPSPKRRAGSKYLMLPVLCLFNTHIMLAVLWCYRNNPSNGYFLKQENIVSPGLDGKEHPREKWSQRKTEERNWREEAVGGGGGRSGQGVSTAMFFHASSSLQKSSSSTWKALPLSLPG